MFLEALPSGRIFELIDLQLDPCRQSLRSEELTWACLSITPGVIFVEDEIHYRCPLFLDEAVRTIEFTGEADTHSNMRWKYTMDPPSLVNVCNI